MRTTRRLLLLAGIAPLLLLSCETKPSGQVMLVIQNGVSIPKDIDWIQIEVSYVKTGAVAWQQDFTKFGNGDGAILLPATLGFTSPEQDPTQPIRVRVTARRGTVSGTNGQVPNVRILREAVTTVPTDRVAKLPLPIDFLCDGSADVELDGSGKVIIKNRYCKEDETCGGGNCVPSVVEEVKLADYDAPRVFGGGDGTGNGVCFDILSCLAGGTEAQLDQATYKKNGKCFANASGAINIGLRTQGSGICGANGCYVALDASSDSGWKPGPMAGTIELPTAVCEKAERGEIAGVIQAPMSATACAQKTESIPICGPWSSVGVGLYKPTPATAPIAIADSQQSPASLAIDGTTGAIYWTARGAFNAQGEPDGTGSVKAVAPSGGEPATIAGAEKVPPGEKAPIGEKAPHGLALDFLDPKHRFAIWSDASTGEIRWAPLDYFGVKPAAATLVSGLLQPEGVSFHDGKLFWTELAGNKVYSADITVNAQDHTPKAGAAAEIELEQGTTARVAPRAIAAAADVTCWTYEDKLTSATGSVVCAPYNSTMQAYDKGQVIAEGQSTPRALLLTTDADHKATSVVWANFDLESNNGGIFKMPLQGGKPPMGQQPVPVVKYDYPGGLALDKDGKTLYWSSRSHGVVSRCALSDTPSDCADPKAEIATGQKNPGAIVVDDTSVYWINEGTGVSPDGAIVKLAKPAPAK